jgi:SAM-dependent methyltransferase
MNREHEWFNDDDFWLRYAPIMFDDARWAEVPAASAGIIQLAGLDAAKTKVLDLCCGFGRIAEELARRGFSVTGVDVTEAYLETAREEAVAEQLAIEYILSDVRDFHPEGVFDAALNLYNSFGYFEHPADDMLFVQNAYKSLKPGGVFIIDVLGKEIAVRDYSEAEWFERAGYTVLTESEPLASWGSIWNKWTLFKAMNTKSAKPAFERFEKVFIQRLYAATELERLLLDAGFSTVDFYGDWDLTPYDQHARTLIARGRK